MLKFLLNDVIVDEKNLPSDLTALRYLREYQGLTGTKEGCASGDCGACTLLVGGIEEGELKYTTLNSCITPIHALAGKHLVSVEHLAAASGQLHPAQRAMVECHGSQCGFCTPGFVLSLAGLYEQHQASHSVIDRASVCDAISGNLCRCTGYRPIIDAGLSMTSSAKTEAPDVGLMSQNDRIKAQLEEMKSSHPIPRQDSETGYLRPANLTELLAAKRAYPEANLIAGGTDLMLENTQRYRDFERLIDVSQVAELKRITTDDGQLTLGASVTYSELEAFCQVDYPEFVGLLSRIASRQIRNRGTIGGNVANASPIADLPPVLLAFDADINIVKADGHVRTVNINEFYTGYKTTLLGQQELILSFTLERSKLAQFHRFYKISKRMEDDISSVMLAVRFAVEDDRITALRLAFGGMAATPIRAPKAESALLAQAITNSLALDQAMASLREELVPMSDMRASAQYRLDMACNLLKKAWLELNGTDVVSFSGHPLAESILSTGLEGSDHA